jgi:hypothetical protein
MANYMETCKTNHFRVTDEEKYRKLFGLLDAEDTIYDLTETDNDGNIWHAFGCYGTVDYHHEVYDDKDNLVVDEYDFYIWINMLQKILDERDVFILYGAGNEKLRYIAGYCIVASKTDIRSSSIDSEAERLANELLGNNG